MQLPLAVQPSPGYHFSVPAFEFLFLPLKKMFIVNQYGVIQKIIFADFTVFSGCNSQKYMMHFNLLMRATIHWRMHATLFGIIKDYVLDEKN